VVIGNTASQAFALNATVADTESLGLTLPVADDGPIALTSALITSLPGRGTLLYNGNPVNQGATLPAGPFNLVYVPQLGQTGMVTFTYLTSDGELWGNEAQVNINVYLADVDNDGLPDSWEMPIVNANTNDNIRTIQDVRPDDDFDGDGFTNYAEYVAGTDPTDPNSYLRLTVAPAQPPANGLVLSWNSVQGRLYTLQTTTNLSQASWAPVTGCVDLSGTGGEMTVANVIQDSPGAFWRVAVRIGE